MTAWLDIVLGGLFHAAILFLVAAGLQLVFGVQKILNLACGSFYALGAYFAITAVSAMTGAGIPITYFFPVLLASGLLIGLVGLPVERLLRTVYRREESHQLLLTFGLLLISQDVLRYFWGATPRTMEKAYLAFGTVGIGGAQVPVYNLAVIAASIVLASLLGFLLQKTAFGKIVRATAENPGMAEGLGADSGKVYAVVFTAGCMLGTLGGALVVPASAASLDMPVELIVEAFAVVVIGGLGSMRGALLGAIIVGLVRALAISKLPEAEVLSIYVIVIVILIVRPGGLLGKAPV